MPKKANWFLMYFAMAAALARLAWAEHSFLNSFASRVISLLLVLARLDDGAGDRARDGLPLPSSAMPLALELVTVP